MVEGQSFLFALFIAVFLVVGPAHGSDRIYVRGYNKVYPLLPASHRSKSVDEMQAETNAARTHFSQLLDIDAKAKADLLSSVTPVKDQGHRGTCVAFASVALIESQIKQATGRNVDLSEQYIYWESKAIGKINPHSDGSEPIDMLSTVDVANFKRIDASGKYTAALGVPTEASWPYEKIGWFENDDHPDCEKAFERDEERLPTACVTNGTPPQEALNAPKITVSNARVIPSSPVAIMNAILAGTAVEVGLDVYKNAWAMGIDKKNPDPTMLQQNLAGVITMPKQGDTLVGGHAILIVGYDKDANIYLFKNSWGTDEWASKSKLPGFGIIPMAYVQKYGKAVVATVNVPNQNNSAPVKR